MTVCPTCERELAPTARFCGSCGTPVAQQPSSPEPLTIPVPQPYPAPPQPRHSAPRTVLLPAAAGAAVVALAATAVVVFVLPHFTNSAQPGPSSVVANPPLSAPATTTTTTVTTTTTTTEPTTTTPTAATAADLAAEVAADHATAETLVGQWVPQISSKKLGLVVNGVTFGYPEIMADFQTLKAQHPEAVMVNSNDYTNFSGKDFWVTIAATSFGSADEANHWCDVQGFAEQDCYASRLMHTGGPAGNSKTR
ncbi:zinc-ribbon domain-containing protein [Kutzneria sp. NPDC052558]|uniref:zinc-ribbon domain-containing protein n=1 Tax=Kutzneria sp. NPDC052558 TaxID=3364121 RepID=UPI0037CC29DB